MNTKQHFLLPRCTGMNCGSTDANHSPECRAEHAAAVAGGRFVKDAAPIAPRADVPENVIAALDRMCTPLDESRLCGATAAADAYCMKLIRDYVLSAPRADADTAGASEPIMRFNIFVNLINPDPNGMYVRYEDHARAIVAANGKKK